MAGKNPLADDLNRNANVPSVSGGISNLNSRGKVSTNWKKVKWTRKKLFFTSFGLGFHYLVAVVASFVSRIYLITFTLVFVGLMVIFLSSLVRMLDRDDY